MYWIPRYYLILVGSNQELLQLLSLGFCQASEATVFTQLAGRQRLKKLSFALNGLIPLHLYIPLDSLLKGYSFSCITYFLFLSLSFSLSLDMGDFEKQVKERAKELKVLFTKGVKIVENSCKKGWKKVKNLKKR
jgi:hypothetical protein